jgi:hypothetical protein
MKIKELIKEIDSNRTYADKIRAARTVRKENEENELVIKAVDHYLDSIRIHVNSLLSRIKESDNEAWEEFSELPDIRNFMHYYTHNIGEFYRFRYSMEVILNEVRLQMFYHIKRNYRPYDKVDEISLLIHSMRSWIKFKVGKGLSSVYKPKKEEEQFLPNIELIDETIDETKEEMLEIAQGLLTEECYKVFYHKIVDDFTLTKIGEVMGFSVDTAKRRYDKSIVIMKEYYETI